MPVLLRFGVMRTENGELQGLLACIH